MKFNYYAQLIPARYYGYFALLIWGVLTFVLLRQDTYALDEGAAKSLLLDWSIVDQVASTAVTFGIPDLRAFFFAPASFLWTGNVVAAKISSMLFLAIAIWLFYLWARKIFDAECALLSTGLFLISPLTLAQIDSLSPGVFLVFAFAIGAWLDDAYRSSPKHLGGFFFAQLIVCAICVSLHPAGLAYPLVLIWSWRTNPLDRIQQRYFFIGVGFIVLFTLFVRMGWNDISLFQNPINSLATVLLGPSLNTEMSLIRWFSGLIVFTILIALVIKQFRILLSDFIGRTFFIGLAMGAFVSDTTWGMIALFIILFYGFPLLLGQQHLTKINPAFKRSAVLMLVVILSTICMHSDRERYDIRESNILPDLDNTDSDSCRGSGVRQEYGQK